MAIAATPSAAKFDIKTNTVAKHSRNTHDDHRAKTHDLDINKIIEGMNGNEKIRHPNEINRKHNLMPSPLVEGFTGHFAKSIHSKSKYPEFPYESQSTKSHQSSADPEDTKDGPLNDEKEKKKYHRFSKTKFDENYPVHDLCDQIHSGGQTDNLEWSESADRILKVIGNGVMKNGYNMFMAPGQVEGKSTEVSVAIYIESMSSFKAQTMDFEIDMYLALGWYDRRLAHNCSHPILVTHKFIADRFFTPDLYFVNSRFAYLQEVTTPNFMLYVYPDGMIFKSMRIDATLSCVMDLKLFPWDSQECSIIIQSYAYIENLLTLSWHVDPPHFPIGSNSEIKLNDMEIKGTRFESCSGPYPMFRGQGNWSCVKAIIKMKRLILFHLIQIFLPASMLVVVSMLSLWLDPRASPARIALATTSLLTVITLGNGQRADLPQVSYLKGSDYWLAFSQSLIFMVLIEYSFVSYYMTKKTTHCHHKRVLEGEDSNEDHQCMGTNGQDFATGKEKMLLPEWDAEKRNKKRFRMGYFRNRSEDSAFRIKKKNHGFSNGFKPDYQINGIKGKRLSVEHGLYGEEYRKPLDTTPYSVATGIGKCMNATAIRS
uniref:Cation transporter family protein n=1 Tax=Rhabditophanes sp. KR3021 TaxID=114890 RepID=A0AC35UB93_9BILA